MKISKASWMILSAGAFIIVLAALGLTRSGQVKELERVSEELRVTTTRLNNTQTTQFQAQIGELEEQLRDAQSQTNDVKERLKQVLVSVDVYEKFFKIVDYYGVTLSNVTVSRISEQDFENIGCEVVSIGASVSGDLKKVTDFVIGLNNNFSTGFVKSIQLTMGEENSSLGFQMIVYSKKAN